MVALLWGQSAAGSTVSWSVEIRDDAGWSWSCLGPVGLDGWVKLLAPLVTIPCQSVECLVQLPSAINCHQLMRATVNEFWC